MLGVSDDGTEEREERPRDREPSDDESTGSADAESGADDEPRKRRVEGESDDDGRISGFLGNVKNARSQLGDAKDAFSTARSGGKLPTDEEGRVRIVCRRHDERRLAPLDDKGRPTCYEAGHEDCEDCVEAIRDQSVETW